MIAIIKKFRDDVNIAELLKGASATFFIRSGALVFNFILVYLISKNFGVKELGVYSLSLILLQIVTVIGKMGTDTAMMRFVSEYSINRNFNSVKKMSRLALSIILPFSVILSFFVFFYSDKIAVLVFNKNYLTPFLKIAAIGIVPNVFLFLNVERIRGLKQIKYYSFFYFLSVPLFTSVLLGVSILLLNGIVHPLIAYILSVILSSVLSLFIWTRKFDFIKKKFKDSSIGSDLSKVSYLPLMKLALPLLMTKSLMLLMGWADTIMLGIFRSTFEVGLYRVPLRISMISSIFLIAFNSILGPKLTELWEKGKIDELQRIMKLSTAFIFWASLPLFLILLVFRDQFLGIFGAEFKTVSLALILLLLGQFVNSFVGSVSLLLMVTKRQVVIQNVMFIGTFINILINYFMIPVYGINGAAFASMTSIIFINVIPLLLVKKYFGFFSISLRALLFRPEILKK
ncbi:MAG: MATE family efflux transporter [Acidobacteriota bacterium]